MAVDHTTLKSHWQFLKSRTANDLFAAFYQVTSQLNHTLSLQKKQSEESKNFLAITASTVHKNGKHRETVFEDLFNKEPSNEHIQLGKKLFDQFAEAYRPTICSTRGVMGALLKGTVHTDELPVLIATHLLVNHFSEDASWNEFALLFAMLLHSIGIEEFCSQQ
jgi:hypothetical protein